MNTNWFNSGVRVFDGAMGTLLHRKGGLTGAPELLCREKPDLIREIHEEYVAAGAQALTCNSFGGTSIKLGRHGLGAEAATLTREAVLRAKEAAQGRALVAVSLGPTGELLEPLGGLSFDDTHAAYLAQAVAARDAGADFAIIETMSDIAEARAAALAANKAGLACVMSLTFDGPRMLMGTPSDVAALCAQDAGALAVGINCSGGPEQILPLIAPMRAVCALPIVVQPNAGLPQVMDGRTAFPYTPEIMTPKMAEIIAAGASAIGGCCGTTPEHIAAFAALASGHPAPKPLSDGVRFVTSARLRVSLLDALKSAQEVAADIDALMDADGDALIVDVRPLSPSDIAAFITEAQQMSRVPLLFRCDGEQASAARRYYNGVTHIVG